MGTCLVCKVCEPRARFGDVLNKPIQAAPYITQLLSPQTKPEISGEETLDCNWDMMRGLQVSLNSKEFLHMRVGIVGARDVTIREGVTDKGHEGNIDLGAKLLG